VNSRIFTTLGLVFLAGVATGMLGMRYGLHEMLHPTVSAAPRDTNPSDIVEQFRTRLDLSPEQAEKISVVLEDYRRYYDSLQDQIDDLRLRDQIEDLRSTGKSRIMQILDEGQRVKFQKMVNELAPELNTDKK
jgi:hypothetical protein